jgi:chemotaxis methyl-accepting protein methylase
MANKDYKKKLNELEKVAEKRGISKKKLAKMLEQKGKENDKIACKITLKHASILRNNPTFDEVYDYVQELIFAVSNRKMDMNNPIDASLLRNFMEGWRVTK